VLRASGDVERLKLTLGNGKTDHPWFALWSEQPARARTRSSSHPWFRGHGLAQALAGKRTEVIKESSSCFPSARARGRGFPHWHEVGVCPPAAGETRSWCANADEGGRHIQDRVILTEAADLVFEGMTIAGYGVARPPASSICAANMLPARLLESLLKERREAVCSGATSWQAGVDFDIRIQLAPGPGLRRGNRAGSARAKASAGDPKNRARPSRAQSGYRGWPTVINNVETFCCVSRSWKTVSGLVQRHRTKTAPGTRSTGVPLRSAGGSVRA